MSAKADTPILDLSGDMSIPAGESATVELLDEMGMHKYFDPGTGLGATVTYSVMSEDDSILRGRVNNRTGVLTLTARDIDDTIQITVTATDDGDATAEQSFLVEITATALGTPLSAEELAELPSFAQSSSSPGDNANYDVNFQVTDVTSPINTRNDDLIIEFHEDYGIPATMRNTSVAVTTKPWGRRQT